jgi:hypothetical protein
MKGARVQAPSQGSWQSSCTEEGTDRRTVERQIVSLTPLRLDLTDERKLEKVRAKQPLDEAPAARTPLPVPAEAGE